MPLPNTNNTGNAHKTAFPGNGDNTLIPGRTENAGLTKAAASPDQEASADLFLEDVYRFYDGSIIIADRDGRILSCSEGSAQFLGHPREALVGMTMTDLVAQGVLTNSVILKCLSTEAEARSFLYARGTSPRGIYAYAKPIRDESGALVRVIAFSQDERTSQAYYAEMENNYKKQLAPMFNSALPGASLEFIAESPQSRMTFEFARQIAATDTNVILCGESGTGKELLARFIHQNSLRRNQILLPINCATFPEEMLEAEFSGYDRSRGGAGAASRSLSDQPDADPESTGSMGLLELANGGTIFLDEISELPLSVQPKLLRVLEAKEFRCRSNRQKQPLNIRIIATTNRDLAEMVREGTFRKDLYYRLASFSITLTPLRQRPEDIAPLAAYYLNIYNQKYGRDVVMPKNYIHMLEGYAWPGNVRELKNVIRRYCITGGGLASDALPGGGASLPGYPMEGAHTPPDSSAEAAALQIGLPAGAGFDMQHKVFLEHCEKIYFTELIERTGGNISAISALTGLHISGIYKKLDKLGIDYRSIRKSRR